MVVAINLSAEHSDDFWRNGFVIVEGVLTSDEVEEVSARFEPIFRGEFSTGVEPDEWNWRFDGGDPSLTRQICNGWRADTTIAALVRHPDIGRACATLRGWEGARLNQDNVLWKPPGAKALGFHQDESYQQWNVPGEMMTCWITLDDTHADHGTIEYARGSHRWGLAAAINQFHGPDDPLADLQAAAGDLTIELAAIEVPAGSAVLHHGRVWHGSRSNSGDRHRRSVVAHCMPANSTYHPTNDHPIYGRYRQGQNLELPADVFPKYPG